ncbi:MAG: tyrosine-type recombinase/integrase [Myxococcales bacterium]
MSRKATGTLIRLKDGRYQGLVTTGDGKRKRLPPFPAGMSEAMAREKVAFYAEKFIERVFPSKVKKAATVPADDCERWLAAWHAERVARGLTSAKDSLAHWHTHVEPVFGAKHPKAWTRDDFRRLSAALDAKVQSKAFSWKSAQNVWGTATKMADDACNSKHDTIRCRTDNAAEGVRGPDRGEKTARQYLYPSEVERFLQCEDVPLEWRRLVAVATYTYCRAGELRALEWADVDVERGVLSVTKSIDRETGALKSTKSKAPRLVPIEAELRPLLRVMRAEAGSEGRVLDLPNGRHLARDMRTWLRAAGIERRSLFTAAPSIKRLRFHDLRSTGVTWMAVRGDEPLRIQQRAGHTDFNTTQGYIREAEVLREGFGRPFPEIPEALIRNSRVRLELPEMMKGQHFGAGLSLVTVEAPGIEPGSARRPANPRSRA